MGLSHTSSATPATPPETGEREAAVYHDTVGNVPADHMVGEWRVMADWRGVPLWSTATGEPLQIDALGVTPADIGATDIERADMTTVWDGAGWVIDAVLAEQRLLDLRASRLSEINDHAAKLLATLSASYPDGEVQSWSQQTREAELLVGGATGDTPLLSAIATARGVPLTELAERVRAKVQAYAIASGRIIGQRQALEDALMAVDLQAPDAAEQLEAITWPAA